MVSISWNRQGFIAAHLASMRIVSVDFGVAIQVNLAPASRWVAPVIGDASLAVYQESIFNGASEEMQIC
jgi:hypothetical protein